NDLRWTPVRTHHCDGRRRPLARVRYDRADQLRPWRDGDDRRGGDLRLRRHGIRLAIPGRDTDRDRGRRIAGWPDGIVAVATPSKTGDWPDSDVHHLDRAVPTVA